jgi:glycosidase
MAFVDHAVLWHVYPLGACGAPIRQGDAQSDAQPVVQPVVHRLRQLEGWLDYVVELGCSALLLGPVFASASHGYDTLDHFRIDPRLGDDADFDRLVRAADERGLSVVLDGVFNHVSRDHHLVREALADPRFGHGDDLVRIDRPDGVPRPRGWEGHDDLVELDHGHKQVADLVTEVMLHWLRRGARGWRLDVAYAVPPAFWHEVLARVRSEFPDALFLGEVIHGDYAEIAAAGTLDSVTQYELWKALWSALVDRNLWELAWALERHDQFSRHLVLQTFVGNHDVDRIASTVGDDGAALALVVLMTVPGMPSVYYGDEQAFRGRKGEGFAADDAVRPELPESPADLAPDGAWMYRLHQRLIGLRRRHPWLVRARLRVVDKTNTTIGYECTDDEFAGSGHTLQVRLDLGDRLTERVTAEITVDDGERFTWPE